MPTRFSIQRVSCRNPFPTYYHSPIENSSTLFLGCRSGLCLSSSNILCQPFCWVCSPRETCCFCLDPFLSTWHRQISIIGLLIFNSGSSRVQRDDSAGQGAAAQLGSPGCKLWNPGSGRWVDSGDLSPSLHVCATAWVRLHKVNYLKRRKTIPPSLLHVFKGKTTYFKLSFQLKACLSH